MAYSTVYSNGVSDNMVRRFVVDTVDELSTINISQLRAGSTAFVIKTSETYMLSNARKWEKVVLSSGGGNGGSSGSEDVIYDGGNEDEDDRGIVYDGGDEDG